MTVRTWQTVKVRYCKNAESKVALEAHIAYAPEHLPDQPARVFAHRCSHGAQCMLLQKGSCRWSGANPNYDPFDEED